MVRRLGCARVRHQHPGADRAGAGIRRSRDGGGRVQDDARHVDPAGAASSIDPASLDAVHQVEVAVEWIERAFGALLDAHHETGHAQGLLLEAADALDAAGHGELARRARSVAALDAVHGRWTYQIVDEYRAHMLEPARALDDGVRAGITGGLRHCLEADQKRRTPGTTSGTAVHLPPDTRTPETRT